MSSISFSHLRADLANGRLTPRELLERCIERIAKREKKLRAFVTVDLRAARKSADASTRRYKAGRPLSPVDGCPIGVKDIIDTADLPTQMNSPIYKGWRPRRDAACVAALTDGGAVVVGKTVTTEFAIGRSGPTTNPFNPKRTPGGSSSGSAASVAAGMVSAALGTQTQGSILRPASYCGVVGFKPTIGALPTGGIHLLSPTCDHLGVIASSVEDAWGIASQISLGVGSPGVGTLHGAGPAPDQRRPAKLIRLYTRGWDEIDDHTRDAFNDVVEHLHGQGIEIDSRDSDHALGEFEDQLDQGIDGQLGILTYEMRWPYQDYITRYGTSVGPRIRSLVNRGHAITPADYEALLARRREMQVITDTWLSRCDGFVTLASSGPATVGLAQTGSRTFPSYGSWLGLPAFSLPLMTVKGMPVGLQLLGRAATDAALCATALWMMNDAALHAHSG